MQLHITPIIWEQLSAYNYSCLKPSAQIIYIRMDEKYELGDSEHG